ncbi:MAG TPA: MFS transporter [Acidimicrobiia bacterium]
MQRAGFVSMLVTAMGVATFVAGILSILSAEIIDEFDITRQQFGLLITALLVTGAGLSFASGKITDAIGGKAGFFLLFALAAAAYAVYGFAPAYWVMALGGLVGAMSNSLANPTTNKLISLHIPAGRRSVITGIKQSGVQGAVFFGGILLPDVARRLGWRGAMFTVAVFSILFLPLVAAAIPRDTATTSADRQGAAPVPGFVRWLALYGFLLGFAGSVTFLIPLFAQESLGMSADAGGTAAAVAGLAAFVGRIAWARIAERRDRYVVELLWIAVLSAGAGYVLLQATPELPSALWVGVVLVGLTSSSWNSVGMLAVISRAGVLRTGGATGTVQGGFLLGLGIGPPIFGRLVDRTGSYDSMWLLSIGFVAAAALLCATWLWRDRVVRARR